MTTNPTDDSKGNPQGDASPPTGEEIHADPRQETDQPAHSQREPLPVEFREFTVSVRELFREIKKFVIFIRNRKNANAILVFLTFLLAIAAFTQAVIYGLQLVPLRHGAEAAQNEVKTMEKQLEMSERPWVTGEFFATHAIEFQPNGDIGIQIRSVRKNIGHSVATGVHLVLGSIVEGKGAWFMDVPKEQKKECDEWRGLLQSFPILSERDAPLFPGDTYVENMSFVIRKDDIDKAVALVGGRPMISGIALFGCIDYQFAFAKGHHQTWFSYDLIKIPPQQPPHPTKFNEAIGGAAFWFIGEDIPAPQLTIRHSLFGTFNID